MISILQDYRDEFSVSPSLPCLGHHFFALFLFTKIYFSLQWPFVYILSHLMPPGNTQFASEVIFSLLHTVTPCNYRLLNKSWYL